MLVYLGCSAVLAFVAALAAALAAVPPAPTFHLAFAAGALPLVFGAVSHFVPVLTRSGKPPRLIHFLPLPVQLAGIAAPLALAGLLPYWSLHAAASAVALVALVMIAWISRCLRATLGAPHPGARWYGAALLCLFFAVSLVPVWLALPELRAPLRLFHLHLNTLGFIGLAALGTLPVLLPTALRRPDSEAANRLRRDLLPASAGALLVAAGAAGGFWLAVPGTALLCWVGGRNLLAWRRSFGWREIGRDGAALPLAGATAGFVLLLLLGLAHGGGWLPARAAIAGFAVMFLMLLVTGALSQLLPVWRHPGADSPRRRVLRERLVRGGHWRAALFCAGGLLLALDVTAGVAGVAAGLASFAADLLRAFRLDRPGASDDNRALP
jgi:hypothetical protein